MKGNIKIILHGGKILTLRPNNHVATGGEGAVYRASNIVIKLYSDSQKMERDNMADKINFLSTLANQFIVAPKGVVKNQKDQPVGYYMDFVKGEPLARVFTNDFRNREGFTDDNASTLVDYMREVFNFAHSKGAILVDANEMNWLVDLKSPDDPQPRAIDVDSWSIGQWKPSVIMPSIRDWHSKGFNELTDWFAWAIVTFQIYTGIHPYKGKLDGYKPNDLEERMKANASVFTAGVRLNRAVRDFSCIPDPLLDWYTAVFQQGERSEPPSPFTTTMPGSATQAARVMYTSATTTGSLVFDKLYSKADDKVIRVFTCGAIMLESGKIIDISTKHKIAQAHSRSCQVVAAEKGWLKGDIDRGQFKFSFINSTDLKEQFLNLDIAGHGLVRYENRLFVITDKGLTEMKLKIFGKSVLSVGQTWGVMVNSTRWFDGVGIQDAMGAAYLITPFDDNACAQVRVPELDYLQPVMARAGNRFVVVVGLDRNGIYQKIEFTLDKDYSSYKIRQSSTDEAGLNIAILPKGVCATIIDDGELNIFVPTSGVENIVSDKNILTDMNLSNWDNKVVYIQNGELWTVRMASTGK